VSTLHLIIVVATAYLVVGAVVGLVHPGLFRSVLVDIRNKECRVTEGRCLLEASNGFGVFRSHLRALAGRVVQTPTVGEEDSSSTREASTIRAALRCGEQACQILRWRRIIV